jgi:ADP-ribose pyrophosphatase YjhB (NUDIX family)
LHVPVIEVVVGALVRERQVLLAYRSQSKGAYPAVWELPGGVVEPGESELDALTRELHEELSVHIATDSAFHLCRVTAGPAEAPALLSAWLVSDWEGTPTNIAPEEHDDIRWFDIDDMPPPAHLPVRAALASAMRSQRR